MLLKNSLRRARSFPRGSLGVGKTVFAKGRSEPRNPGSNRQPHLHPDPEYEGTLPLYHMDLYRIDSVEEFEPIGGRSISTVRGSR